MKNTIRDLNLKEVALISGGVNGGPTCGWNTLPQDPTPSPPPPPPPPPILPFPRPDPF